MLSRGMRAPLSSEKERRFVDRLRRGKKDGSSRYLELRKKKKGRGGKIEGKGSPFSLYKEKRLS